MIIIDQNGQVPFIAGTKTPQQSNHPAYRARIELALPAGSWLYAPTRGHNLARFSREKQSDAMIEEFQKEVALYLSSYSPAVQAIFVDRSGIEMDLSISDQAISQGTT